MPAIIMTLTRTAWKALTFIVRAFVALISLFCMA